MKFKAKYTKKYTQIKTKGTTSEILTAITFIIGHTLRKLAKSEEDFEDLKGYLKTAIDHLNYDGTIK